MPTPLKNVIDKLARGDLRDLLWSVGLLLAAVVAGVVLAKVLRWVLRHWVERTSTDIDDRALARFYPPLRVVLPVLFVRGVLPLTTLSEGVRETLSHACLIAMVAVVGWLLAAGVAEAEQIVNDRFDVAGHDNLQARAVRTQVRGFRNVGRFLIAVLTLSGVLMTFEGVRELGVSLLASAGVAGIAIGFAAQRSIATLIAGIQIALTQPIRVDDVVIVEGEWGRIEEITLTYVVIQIWDLRRLVVPITYFIEQPFQNWTRVSADMMGTVFLYVDYKVPIDELRNELMRILEESEQWDRAAASLIVTNTTERTVELRALMSARDSGKLWELRCHVREQLVVYLQRAHPECLPRVRAELEQISHPRQREAT